MNLTIDLQSVTDKDTPNKEIEVLLYQNFIDSTLSFNFSLFEEE